MNEFLDVKDEFKLRRDGRTFATFYVHESKWVFIDVCDDTYVDSLIKILDIFPYCGKERFDSIKNNNVKNNTK